MTEPIITSLLDTDLYKYTMLQCVWHHFPNTQVEYHFKCRKPVDLRPYVTNIQAQIDQFCRLRLTEDELSYLGQLPFFKADFIDYLRHYQLNRSTIHITRDEQFSLIIKGPWIDTILFEVPLLAIISQSYYQQNFPHTNVDVGRAHLQEKVALVRTCPELRFSDFGTRRRFSKVFQAEVIETFKNNLPEQFIGTSNLYFAKKFNLWPIGTMAHEYLQAAQVLAPNIKGSQAFALKTWLKEYPDMLGIALTDVITMDVFLQEFDASLAKQYRGLRQDSGDPIVWGEKALKHYAALGIDPQDKMFVFSDSLTIPKAIEIYRHFAGRVNLSFGIGTNLTNDVGYEPLDIVIKMTHTNNLPVIKISDSPGKIICEDPAALKQMKQIFHLLG